MTWDDVLAHTTRGEELLCSHTASIEDHQFAINAKQLLEKSGRATKSGVVGALGLGIPNKEIAKLSHRSISHAKQSKQHARVGEPNIVTLNMRPNVTRQSISVEETVSESCVCCVLKLLEGRYHQLVSRKKSTKIR